MLYLRHCNIVYNICLRVLTLEHYIRLQWRHNEHDMASQITTITTVSIVCSTVCSGADQRIHQSSASLAFVRGIHRWPVDSPHKGPVTRKMFPFDDVIMTKGVMQYITSQNHYELQPLWIISAKLWKWVISIRQMTGCWPTVLGYKYISRWPRNAHTLTPYVLNCLGEI